MTGQLRRVPERRPPHASVDSRLDELLTKNSALVLGERAPVVRRLDGVRVAVAALVVGRVVERAEEATRRPRLRCRPFARPRIARRRRRA